MLWEREYPKIPPGPPVERLKAIERVSARIGEDPEGCAAEPIRFATQRERLRLVTLVAGKERIPPAAVYVCGSLSEGLRCVGAVADDTAHLGEMQALATPLPSSNRLQLQPDPQFAFASRRVYIAPRSTLMDRPRYTEPTPDADHSFEVPHLAEALVLIAIVKESSGSYIKFVWLLAASR